MKIYRGLEVNGQLPAPATLFPEKEYLYRRLVGLLEPVLML